MLLSSFTKAAVSFGHSFCAGPILGHFLPEAPTYEWGQGYIYEDDEECEFQTLDLKGYICGLTTKEFDDSCVPSNVSKLIILNCDKTDFSCFSCFEMVCEPWKGRKFQIFKQDGKDFIITDKMNFCVEIYVIEVPSEA